MSVSTTSTFSSHPPETNSDIVTSWLPITSAWPAVPECQTGGIYSQIGDNGALQIAYDPFFGISVEPSLTCLPPFATLWWSESTTVPLFTKTSLGPLVCPEAYSTAYSSTLNAQSTFVACCPSSYKYITSKDAGTIGECTSTLTVGQVYTFVNLTSAPHTAIATIQPNQLGAAVYAVQVNGYVFAPASTTSSSTTSTSTTSAEGLTSGTPTSTGSISPTHSSTSNGLSTGAKAGIGIAVALGVLGIASLVAAFFIMKRRKYKNTGPSDGSSPWLGRDSYFAPLSPKKFWSGTRNRYELDTQGKASRPPVPVYEVSGEGMPREMQ